MYIYMHTDHGHAFDVDFGRLGLLKHVCVMDLSVDPAHAGRRAVAALCRPYVQGLVVPDDVERHTPPLESVKQCARVLDIPVMSVQRFIQTEQPSNSSAGGPTVSPHGERSPVPAVAVGSTTTP